LGKITEISICCLNIPPYPKVPVEPMVKIHLKKNKFFIILHCPPPSPPFQATFQGLSVPLVQAQGASRMREVAERTIRTAGAGAGAIVDAGPGNGDRRNGKGK
jgi:hypothetical protein